MKMTLTKEKIEWHRAQIARKLYDSGYDLDEIAVGMRTTYEKVSEWLVLTARPKDGC